MKWTYKYQIRFRCLVKNLRGIIIRIMKLENCLKLSSNWDTAYMNAALSPLQCIDSRTVREVTPWSISRLQQPHPFAPLRNQQRLEKASKKRTFNRSWQVLALAEGTVCRLQWIPSTLHSATSADFIKVHLRTHFALSAAWSQDLLFSFRCMMSKMATACCSTAWWITSEHTASCCSPK